MVMIIEQIDVQTLKADMDRGAVLLVDVRELPEYDEAHIDGAALIPMSQIDPLSLPCNPDKKIVFQCAKGGRSQKVCEAYIHAFPGRTVYNLAGGITAWIAAGLPVETIEAAA